MKKLVFILGFVLVAASCQKEQIAPRECSTQGVDDRSMTTTTADDQTNSNTPTGAQTINSSDGTTVTPTPGSNGVDDGEITDPMRKKERKG